MGEILIKNGRVLNPASGFDQVADIRLVAGRVEELRPRMRQRSGTQVIDAVGKFVFPGLVDMHTHLREPGGEHKETIRTGTEAAAAGGFTTVVCMANTQPANDNAAVTRYIRAQIAREASVNVLPVGAATKNLEGLMLAEIGEMSQYGIVAVSDDGHCIVNAHIMRKVMEYSKSFGLPVITHSEDPAFAGYAGVNEGWVATQLGLHGSPGAAEAVMVARDTALASLTRARIHIAHISSGESVEIIKGAKEKGIPVTCEVTPHHLLLTEDEVLGFRTEAKVNPPLRTEEDRRQLLSALKNGVIDVIATDHAPHSTMEKHVTFDEAAPGMVGLETALSVAWTVGREIGMSELDLLAKLSCNPARILNLNGKGNLEIGSDADVVIFDPDVQWTVDPSSFRSRSHNTAFGGKTLQGRVVKTIFGGEIVYERE